jgi:uncharacterized membrane protein YhfC
MIEGAYRSATIRSRCKRNSMEKQVAALPYLFVAGAGMIAVAILALKWWQRRTGPAAWFIRTGALAWIVGVALKFCWAIPTNGPIHEAFNDTFGTLGSPIWWLYVGLLTGVFECGATWVIVRTTQVRNADQNQSVAFGLGFGAVEALLLGILCLTSFGKALLYFIHLPADARAKLTVDFSGLLISPLPAIERLYSIASHAISCVLIIWSVQQRRAVWFWASFAYKSAIDSFATWGVESFHIKTSIVHLLEFHLMLLLYVGLSLIAFLHLHKRVARPQATTLVDTEQT